MSSVKSRVAAFVESAMMPGRFRMYRSYLAGENDPLEARRGRQDAALAAIVAYAVQSVPYYRNLFARMGIPADGIRTTGDLASLPVLTKAMIREDPGSLVPIGGARVRYVQGRTGGSTGQPLSYRMSPDDYHAGVALMYRGWGYAGYRPGDRMVVVAGGSLTATAPDLIDRVRDLVSNRRNLSSYGMTPERMADYARLIASWRPRFVRGYATSLVALSGAASEGGIGPHDGITAVFSTAECLSPAARTTIERAFGCEVFDTYGLNDGGVSAYECAEHTGLHVDLERSVLEVVDDAGRPVVGRPGRILATSLLNRAMPFIRYDTGDIGVMAPDACACGRTGPLLSEILGRQTDLLVVNGVTIGSPVLTLLMSTTSASWYQIVQTDASGVTFRIVNPDPVARRADEARIVASMHVHVGDAARIAFEYLAAPDDVAAGDKHRVIVNRWRRAEESATGPAGHGRP